VEESAAARRIPRGATLTAKTFSAVGEALTLSDVDAGYPGLPPVIQRLSLSFGSGVTLLIGPNGAGKSTLLKSIVGLARVRQGSIVANGEEIQQLQPWKTHRVGVSLVPQGRCNFPRMTVHENLELGLSSLRRSVKRSRLDEVYDRFPMLREKHRQLAGNLSGGEQQILEMAMVLEARPRILLIDEPSLGLSPHAQDEIFDIVRAVADRGTPVVMAEQNVLRAARKSDRVVVLIGGRVARDVDAADVVDGKVDLHEAFLGRAAADGAPSADPRL
jgi:branched-chain amino acid transport system ATP-binding protein